MLVFLLLWAENTLGNSPLMGCEIQVLASQANKYPDNPKFLLHPFYGSPRKTHGVVASMLSKCMQNTKVSKRVIPFIAEEKNNYYEYVLSSQPVSS